MLEVNDMTEEEFVEYAEKENKNDRNEIETNGNRVKTAFNKFKKAV